MLHVTSSLDLPSLSGDSEEKYLHQVPTSRPTLRAPSCQKPSEIELLPSTHTWHSPTSVLSSSPQENSFKKETVENYSHFVSNWETRELLSTSTSDSEDISASSQQDMSFMSDSSEDEEQSTGKELSPYLPSRYASDSDEKLCSLPSTFLNISLPRRQQNPSPKNLPESCNESEKEEDHLHSMASFLKQEGSSESWESEDDEEYFYLVTRGSEEDPSSGDSDPEECLCMYSVLQEPSVGDSEPDSWVSLRPPSRTSNPPSFPSPPIPPYSLDRTSLSPGSLFDSHCHLDFLDRRLGPLSLRQLVTRDPRLDWATFGGCVAVYCHPRDWRERPSASLLRAAGEERVHLALGCHPHFAQHWGARTGRQLELAIRRLGQQLVALGECGLDYSRKNDVERSHQLRVFRAQVQLAMKLSLPLVLHLREAEEDGLALLREVGLPGDWPVHRHCFTGEGRSSVSDSSCPGDWETAAAWLRRFPGSRLGVTAAVTHREQHRVHQWVSKVIQDIFELLNSLSRCPWTSYS